jgi:hypothetical protein
MEPFAFGVTIIATSVIANQIVNYVIVRMVERSFRKMIRKQQRERELTPEQTESLKAQLEGGLRRGSRIMLKSQRDGYPERSCCAGVVNNGLLCHSPDCKNPVLVCCTCNCCEGCKTNWGNK